MSVSEPQNAEGIGRFWSATISLALATLLVSLGISIANVALPDIAAFFGAEFAGTQWVVISYLVTLSVFVVAAGRLGDIRGRRNVLVAGLIVFTLGSLLCALAPSLSFLIGARVIQGLGASALMALTLSIVRDVVPDDGVGTAMGFLGTVSAVGTALGPSIGGLLVGFGWQAVFVFMSCMGVITTVIVTAMLPSKEQQQGGTARFDVIGMVLLGLSLAAYALAMTGNAGFGMRELALLALTVALFVAFLSVERRIDAPMVHPDRVRHDAPLAGGLVVNAIVAAVMMSTLVIGPFYLSGALGLNMAMVGMVMAIGPVISIFCGLPSGWLTDRFGAGIVATLGLILMIAGTTALAILPPILGLTGYIGAIVLLTPGYQLFQAANNTAVTARADKSERGVISALLGLSRNLGLVTGASLMGTIFALSSGNLVAATPDTLDVAIRNTFLVESFALIAGLIIAIATRAISLHSSKDHMPAE